MNIFKRFFFLLVLIFLCTMPGYAHITSENHWKCDGKEIIICGDRHIEHQNDKNDYDQLHTLFNHCEHDSNTKTLVLLEYGATSSNKLFLPNDSRLMARIALLTDAHEWQHIQWMPGDIRDQVGISDMYTNLIEYASCLEHNKNNDNSCNYVSLDEYKIKFGNFFGHDDTLEEWIGNIQTTIDQIAQKRDRYSKETPAYQIFDNYYVILNDALKNISAEFLHTPTVNNTMYFKDAVINWIQHKQLTPDALRLFKNTGHFGVLNFVLADIGFVMTLLDNIPHYDRIIFYGGDIHAAALNKCIQVILHGTLEYQQQEKSYNEINPILKILYRN